METIIGSINAALTAIFNNAFFTTLPGLKLSEMEWKKFFVQKYGSVGYFLDFLQNGSSLCEPHSKELSKIFIDNYHDEIGFINNIQQEEYRHENWRLKSLAQFGITKFDLEHATLISSTQVHSELLATLPKGEDFLEYCGALLFLEIFVAREMKHLIKEFERTIPAYFPRGGYKKTNAPHNVHEYWYNHMEHDPKHFKDIKDGVEAYVALNSDKHVEIESRIIRGIEKCFVAKMHLYDEKLLKHMMSK